MNPSKFAVISEPGMNENNCEKKERQQQQQQQKTAKDQMNVYIWADLAHLIMNCKT